MVQIISSPAAKVLALAWAWLCSALLIALAVPPSAVVFILKVAVAVPLAAFVVVSVIVPANGIFMANM